MFVTELLFMFLQIHYIYPERIGLKLNQIVLQNSFWHVMKTIVVLLHWHQSGRLHDLDILVNFNLNVLNNVYQH